MARLGNERAEALLKHYRELSVLQLAAFENTYVDDDFEPEVKRVIQQVLAERRNELDGYRAQVERENQEFVAAEAARKAGPRMGCVKAVICAFGIMLFFTLLRCFRRGFDDESVEQLIVLLPGVLLFMAGYGVYRLVRKGLQRLYHNRLTR